jgi:magnesium transporter
MSEPEATLRSLVGTDVISVGVDEDQERIAHLITQYDFLALPVLDHSQHLVGIVTVDDIIDVISEEATEDIQKIGGMEALDAPYFQIGFFQMVKKRAGWLTALFLGEMLTATAMGYFEEEIARAVVLALFIPLIISSGGNSGSQAATLVIRAMAIGEVRLRDWWRVVRRELGAGLVLGTVLGTIALGRILVWQALSQPYGKHYLLVAFTVASSLVGVVLFGTIVGSMLPILLRRLGFDPASASAPFVATLVDVTGLIIYFTAASLFMHGTLL